MDHRRRDRAPLLALALAACASSAPPPATGPGDSPEAAKGPTEAERIAAQAARKGELSAAHRELEDEQSTALAQTCDRPAPPRDKPKPLRGMFAIAHLVCGASDEGPFEIHDELGAPAPRAFRGRVPKAARTGSWQAAVEVAAATALGPEVARGETVRVSGGWKTLSGRRCVTVIHHARLTAALDVCGSRGQIACEANGNAVAHGLELVRAGLDQAKKLSGAACQEATLAAIATSRGMPRWRQYMQLNTTKWKGTPRYRTKRDGILDEDALFARAAQLGAEALALHADCGGAANPKTTAVQEQAFHTCF
ncbi:MAG: hypothetical protein JNL83_11450 [Myxococcales bacterium]|nr:hypothetical protein [Myxococcales bacterium]